ncbi:MAG: NAD(P)H-binding protein [Solirubrobacteraceae bacterium]
MPTRVLLTGSTGYVGGSLLPELLRGGHHVRCLARDAARAKTKLPAEAEIVEGDVLKPDTLPAAVEGIDVAFYLVHSMEGPSGNGFAARDREGALSFGAAARRAGVKRVVYLGGLEGDGDEKSEHLASRDEVARILASHCDDFVHVRAAMVIGSESASFVMLRSLVEKLPAMICPRWIDTRTQPVSIRDVVGTLAALADLELEAPAEIQLGGADVLTYREMMVSYAEAAGRRPPVIIKAPVLTPRLSSHWVGLVTPVDAGLAKPLVLGLSAEMIVREPPPAGINDEPLGFRDAVRAAIDEG